MPGYGLMSECGLKESTRLTGRFQQQHLIRICRDGKVCRLCGEDHFVLTRTSSTRPNSLASWASRYLSREMANSISAAVRPVRLARISVHLARSLAMSP